MDDTLIATGIITGILIMLLTVPTWSRWLNKIWDMQRK